MGRISVILNYSASYSTFIALLLHCCFNFSTDLLIQHQLNKSNKTKIKNSNSKKQVVIHCINSCSIVLKIIVGRLGYFSLMVWSWNVQFLFFFREKCSIWNFPLLHLHVLTPNPRLKRFFSWHLCKMMFLVKDIYINCMPLLLSPFQSLENYGLAKEKLVTL